MVAKARQSEAAAGIEAWVSTPGSPPLDNHDLIKKPRADWTAGDRTCLRAASPRRLIENCSSSRHGRERLVSHKLFALRKYRSAG
jgi:hypothetical protein